MSLGKLFKGSHHFLFLEDVQLFHYTVLWGSGASWQWCGMGEFEAKECGLTHLLSLLKYCYFDCLNLIFIFLKSWRNPFSLFSVFNLKRILGNILLSISSAQFLLKVYVYIGRLNPCKVLVGNQLCLTVNLMTVQTTIWKGWWGERDWDGLCFHVPEKDPVYSLIN